MPFKRIARPLSVLAAGALLALALPALAQKTTLLVYTALETDQLKAYQEGFNKVNPDIELKWVRDSTGVITAKLLAEKANPQADVVMGVAASSLALLDKNGMLEPYRPLNADAIMSQYIDKKNPPAWFGMDVWGATICFNTVEAAKKGIPKPETWKDLLKPAYKGQIVMPNPASSGTGFFDVTAWLTLWGDKDGKGDGWKFMDGLHENMAQYTHSGSKPCNMAAAGEFVVGISFEYRANANKAKGAPIDLVFPKEGLGWDLEAFAIHKGTKKLAAAKKLADWASSKDAMILYGKNFAITAQPGVAAPLANVPKDYEARLVKMDFPGPPRTASASWPSGTSATAPNPNPRSDGGRGCQALPAPGRGPQGLRQLHRTQGRGPGHRPGRVRLLPRAPAAVARPRCLRIIAGLEVQSAGRIELAGRDISTLAAGRTRLRHRVPELCALSQPERGRQRGLRPGQPQGAQGAGLGAGDGTAQAGGPARQRRPSSRRNSRAASSSASRWPAPWPRHRACCCWMNRCRHWTPSCVSSCAAKSAACSANWA
jgi:iron(III) transport system substrate-binding protein